MRKNNQMPEGVKSAMGWVLGVGIIAFIMLILVVIFGNLSGNMGFNRATQSYVNETGWVNYSHYTLSNGLSHIGYVSVRIDTVYNGSAGAVIASSSYTASSANGTIVGAGVENYTHANISYTVTYKDISERQSEDIIGNYSESATNTSSQFPTVGTIVGIGVLLLILIAILIFAIKRMMGVSNVAGGTGGNRGIGGGRFGGTQEFG